MQLSSAAAIARVKPADSRVCACPAGGSKEKELTLDDVWEGKVVCSASGTLEVAAWTCWYSPAGSEWHDSSSDEEDGQANHGEEQ